MTLSSALISWVSFLSGIVGTRGRGKLQVVFWNSSAQLHSRSLIICKIPAPRKSSSLINILSGVSVYPEVGLPQPPFSLLSLGTLIRDAALYHPDGTYRLFSQLLGGGSLTALICLLSMGIASTEESVIVQGHTHSPGQSPPDDWSVTESRGPASSPQLKKATLKNHPSFPAPVESAEAFSETVL